MSATIGITTDPFPEITAGITAAGDVIKLLDTELAALNSPEAIEARRTAAEAQAVAKMDADLKAAQTAPTAENLATLDKDASG